MNVFEKLALACILVAGMNSAVAQSGKSALVPATGVHQPDQVQTFSGTLVDTDCKGAAATALACEISATTRIFGLQVPDGMVLKLDDKGNANVRAALQNGPRQTGPVRATVRGTLADELLAVESIEIPGGL
ncbi:MAG TPA: hypothetical protein VNH18_08085 [Bryobacteraceae bacterium]|nr:hypothetical protein [Bryobacteraceae bacterium]